MRFSSISLAMLLMVMILKCASGGPAAGAPAGPAYLYAASDNGLILREGPATTAKALKTLPPGSRVTFLEDGPPATISGRTAAWKKVEHEGLTGFAFGGFLSTEKPALNNLATELIQDKWSTDTDMGGYSLKFEEDGRFWENFGGEGGDGSYGNYRIAGDTIFLEVTGGDPRPKRSCKMRKDDTSLTASLWLVCGEGSLSQYYRNNSRLGPGLQRQLGRWSVVTMGRPDWKTITNVKYREHPTLDATAFSCHFDSTFSNIEGVKYGYIPEGKRVEVLARRPEKEQIGEWHNYWYYVIPESDMAGGCDPPRGWVFGQFIKAP